MPKLFNKIFVVVIAAHTLAGCTTTSEKASTSPDAGLATSAKPLYDRSIQLARSGRDKEALEQFSLMTRQHPDIAVGYTNVGLLQLKNGNLDLAMLAFNQAITLDPNDKLAFNHLGVVQRQQGEFIKSRQSYQQALKIDDNYADAHLNLGILYDIYLQELPQALQHYQRFQSLTGSNDKIVEKWIVDLKRRISSSR